MNPPDAPNRWPELAYDEWADTVTTLHLWTQIVGKVRLVLTPWVNHSWHVPLYVTPRGLTTSTMYHGRQPLDIEFDFTDHQLRMRVADDRIQAFSLEPMSVADFHQRVMRDLDDLGLPVDIHGHPNEVEEAIPFEENHEQGAYHADAVQRFAAVLNQSTRVLTEFRAGFLGKNSPVHFFWGSFDLAVTRFSGREAPTHPGGFPNLPDWITREAYSHEVHSVGWFPGNAASPQSAFYAYAYPVPEGLGERTVRPEAAFWSDEMGEWFLPYDAVIGADDPDAALRAFCDSTYDAVADAADWDRDRLEAPSGFPKSA